MRWTVLPAHPKEDCKGSSFMRERGCDELWAGHTQTTDYDFLQKQSEILLYLLQRILLHTTIINANGKAQKY